jgi:hypothetical protein
LFEGFVVKTYVMKDWLKDYCQMLLDEIIVCNIIPSFMIAKKSQELIKIIPCKTCCQSLVFVRNCSMFQKTFVLFMRHIQEIFMFHGGACCN